MKKRRIVLALVIAAIVILATTATAVLAADPAPTTSTTSITIVGPDKEVSIKSPFDVKIGAMSINPPADGKNYFAGEKMASVPVTVTNIGRIPYQINISAHPAKPLDGSWPNFDVRATEKGTTYYQWQMPIIAPGAIKEMTVEISIAYNSTLVSFQGLALDVWPGPAETPTEKG